MIQSGLTSIALHLSPVIYMYVQKSNIFGHIQHLYVLIVRQVKKIVCFYMNAKVVLKKSIRTIL